MYKCFKYKDVNITNSVILNHNNAQKEELHEIAVYVNLSKYGRYFEKELVPTSELESKLEEMNNTLKEIIDTNVESNSRTYRILKKLGFNV